MMGKGKIQSFHENKIGFLSFSDFGDSWSNPQDGFLPPAIGGLFVTVGQTNGVGFGGISLNLSRNDGNGGTDFKFPYADLYVKYVSSPEKPQISGTSEEVEKYEIFNGKKKSGFKKLKVKVANPSLRRLISGAIAGAVSRTVVAPLETIRTHLMVGSSGHSTTEVFNDIMKSDGWKGLFRGNFVNVIRVAPSKAIELFAYDTVNKRLSHKPGEEPKVPIPASLIAGACAGVSSTLCTYPVELLKTRITIQVCSLIYKSIFYASKLHVAQASKIESLEAKIKDQEEKMAKLFQIVEVLQSDRGLNSPGLAHSLHGSHSPSHD